MASDSIITIGKNPTCDLTVEGNSVTGLHAQARLDGGRFLWIRDENSPGGTYLKRHEKWVRIRLIAVCAGDLLRFGHTEVTIEQITQSFGNDADVRLAPTPAVAMIDNRTGRHTLKDPDDEPTFAKPIRNSVTGDVEDKSS